MESHVKVLCPGCLLSWTLVLVVLALPGTNGQSCRGLCRVLEWTPWSQCSQTCGGTRTREPRLLCCLVDESRQECETRCRRQNYVLSETQTCRLRCQNGGATLVGRFGAYCRCRNGYDGDCCEKVDGKWGVWGSWGACSASCGGAVRVRSRLCNSPTPLNGGAACPGGVNGSQTQSRSCDFPPCPTQTPVLATTRRWVSPTPTDDTRVIVGGGRTQSGRRGTISDGGETSDTEADNTNIFLGIGLAGTVLILIITVIVVVTIRRRRDRKASPDVSSSSGSPAAVVFQAHAEPIYENSDVREITLDSAEDHQQQQQQDEEAKEEEEAPVEYANSEFSSVAIEEHAEYDHMARTRESSPFSDCSYGHLDLEGTDYSSIQRGTSTLPKVSDSMYGHLIPDEDAYDHLSHSGTQSGVLNENIYNG